MSTLDRQYLDHLPKNLPELLFIFAPHRSGTTFLQHFLAQTGCFNCVSAYDIIEYDNLLYNRIENKEQQVKTQLGEKLARYRDRGLDHIPVGIEYPEEYGFILKLDVYGGRITPENIDKFRLLCRKKRFLSDGEKPLLLKEPSEFYNNFAYIHREFPQAKFLFLHRHPLYVLNSQIKTWKKLVEGKNSYGSLLSDEYAQILNSPRERLKYQIAYRSKMGCMWVFNYLCKGYEYYQRHIGQLPEAQVYALRYEDICRDPAHYMSSIAKFAQQNFPKLDLGFVQPRNSPLLEMVEEVYAEHIEELRDYLEYMQYKDFPDFTAGKG